MSLALNKKSFKLSKLIKKEGTLSMITTIVITFSVFMRVYLEYFDTTIALCISLTLLISIVIAIFLSILFTVWLNRMKGCNASEGAMPLLCSIVDVVVTLILCLVGKFFYPTF